MFYNRILYLIILRATDDRVLIADMTFCNTRYTLHTSPLN